MKPEIKILQNKYNWTSKIYDILDFYPSAGEVIGIDLSCGMLTKAKKRTKKN